MELSNVIKEKRKERKMTQTRLSKISGVSAVQICKYEKGKSKPTSEVLKRLAGALNLPLDYFELFNINDVSDEVLFNSLDQLRKIKLSPSRKATLYYLSKVFIDDTLKSKT